MFFIVFPSFRVFPCFCVLVSVLSVLVFQCGTVFVLSAPLFHNVIVLVLHYISEPVGQESLFLQSEPTWFDVLCYFGQFITFSWHWPQFIFINDVFSVLCYNDVNNVMVKERQNEVGIKLSQNILLSYQICNIDPLYLNLFNESSIPAALQTV